jgi:hypothetical protein
MVIFECVYIILELYKMIPLNQYLIASGLVSKNVKNIICKTIILPIVLYECVTGLLILKEGHRLRFSTAIFWFMTPSSLPGIY